MSRTRIAAPHRYIVNIEQTSTPLGWSSEIVQSTWFVSPLYPIHILTAQVQQTQTSNERNNTEHNTNNNIKYKLNNMDLALKWKLYFNEPRIYVCVCLVSRAAQRYRNCKLQDFCCYMQNVFLLWSDMAYRELRVDRMQKMVNWKHSPLYDISIRQKYFADTQHCYWRPM